MFQKWYLLKCTNLLGILLLGTLNSLEAKTRIILPQLLKEVETQYSRAATLSADFTQITEDTILSKQKKKSSGKIFFKRPSKVRWETDQPDSSLLIGNGKKYLYYTPPFDKGEKGQLVEKKSTEVQSQLAESLLSGSFSIQEIQKIKKQGPTTFELIPEPGMAGSVISAIIEIALPEKLIQKVTLLHRGGNRSELVLSAIILGSPLSNSLFEFTPPPETDRINNSL